MPLPDVRFPKDVRILLDELVRVPRAFPDWRRDHDCPASRRDRGGPDLCRTESFVRAAPACLSLASLSRLAPPGWHSPLRAADATPVGQPRRGEAAEVEQRRGRGQ